MSLLVLEVFLQEALTSVDSSFDVSPGSPFDAKVVQPTLRRLGTDPYTIDLPAFISQRLSEAFPDLAASDGDAFSDGLVKPLLLLLDPLLREQQRLRNAQSMKDPEVLTIEEADALGANLFAERNRGDVARCTFRIYFAQPQKATVSQENFVTTKSGLHFFPTNPQSISQDEMALNLEGSTYYFDISTVAEFPGDEYNIEPGEASSIASLPAAVRITNKVRARDGLPEEDAVQYVGRLPDQLSERSLATIRGALAKIPRAFPEVTRLAVVGAGDPEMLRDVLRGGSLGPILAAGSDATAALDGEAQARSRRIYLPSADLFAIVGPVGAVAGYTLTLSGLFGPNPPSTRDLPIASVVDVHTLEVVDQVIFPSGAVGVWMIRRTELRLAGIPGGILFPDSPNGTVGVVPDAVHVGGCSDFMVRGAGLNSATLVVDQAADESPALEGTALRLVTNGAPPPSTFVVLEDYILGSNYNIDDETYRALTRAKTLQYSLEIADGVAAGVYRVLDVIQLTGASPIVLLDPLVPVTSGLYRWRLVDELTIDLVEPKLPRIAGARSNGTSVQGEALFSTSDGVDFDALGVSTGDVLRLMTGEDAGDYRIEAVTPPFYTTLELERPLTRTSTGLTYEVFRPNIAGGVRRPLVRVTGVDVLDANGQPLGTKVPYACPVNVLSAAFQNPGIGVKVSTLSGRLGLMTKGVLGDFASPGGVLALTWDGASSPLLVSIGSGSLSPQLVVDTINVAAIASLGAPAAKLLIVGSTRYVGFVPIGPNTRLDSATSPGLLLELFGDGTYRSSRDVRVDTVDWAGIRPAIDYDLDALQILDGVQAGFASGLTIGAAAVGFLPSTGLTVERDFAPEAGRSLRVGGRSLGAGRFYFLDPTTVEVGADTVVTTTSAAGVVLNFKPDPTLRRQVLPALPNGDKSHVGAAVSTSLFKDARVDFLAKGVREGDILVLDFQPVTGSVNLADPVPGLALKSLLLSLGGGPDKSVVFVNDVATPGAVSRASVVSQINSAVGLTVASIKEVSVGDFRLVLDPELELVVRPQVGVATSANPVLGLSSTLNTLNRSTDAGQYRVLRVGGALPVDTISVTQLDGSAASLSVVGQQYSIVRVGYQRIAATAMALNKAEAGLYYWDVQLVSEGPGDLWNIDAGMPMTATGYQSDGYRLTTEDVTTSFSPLESLALITSRSVLEVGVDDDPQNATQLTGQSLLISYDYAASVDGVQSFVISESERVVLQNPLARHLVPNFVRFDLSYVGGGTPAELRPVLEKYIRELRPEEALGSSEIQRIVSSKGGTSIRNPIELIAVVCNPDRTIKIVRSKDALSTGRLAAFVPDLLNLERRVR